MFIFCVFVDGFSKEYVTQKHTPFIYDLSQQSFFGKVNPSALFSADAYYTGVNEDKNGLLASVAFDPSGNRPKLPAWFCTLDRFCPSITKKVVRHLGNIALAIGSGGQNLITENMPLHLSRYFFFTPIRNHSRANPDTV